MDFSWQIVYIYGVASFERKCHIFASYDFSENVIKKAFFHKLSPASCLAPVVWFLRSAQWGRTFWTWRQTFAVMLLRGATQSSSPLRGVLTGDWAASRSQRLRGCQSRLDPVGRNMFSQGERHVTSAHSWSDVRVFGVERRTGNIKEVLLQGIWWLLHIVLKATTPCTYIRFTFTQYWLCFRLYISSCLILSWGFIFNNCTCL